MRSTDPLVLHALSQTLCTVRHIVSATARRFLLRGAPNRWNTRCQTVAPESEEWHCSLPVLPELKPEHLQFSLARADKGDQRCPKHWENHMTRTHKGLLDTPNHLYGAIGLHTLRIP